MIIILFWGGGKWLNCGLRTQGGVNVWILERYLSFGECYNRAFVATKPADIGSAMEMGASFKLVCFHEVYDMGTVHDSLSAEQEVSICARFFRVERSHSHAIRLLGTMHCRP
jgi:hypothetical protein